MTTTEKTRPAGGFSDRWSRLVDALYAPVDGAGLAVCRLLFGMTLAIGIGRYAAAGWIDTQLVEPKFFFSYFGLDFITPWSRSGLYLHYGVLFVLALAIAAGFWTRTASALFALGFAWAEAFDVTNYLNHYVLVVLLAALLALTPAGRLWSIDAWRRPAWGRHTVPRWSVWLLRGQVACVYFFAALAKAGPDWLGHALPLRLWLPSRDELPLIGPWLGAVWVAYAASWAGFLYDLTIPLWLSWRRSRPLAFVVVLIFHGLTSVFFEIGMFPAIMTLAATLFFAPSWPRDLARRVGRWVGSATEGWTDAPWPVPTPRRSALHRLGLVLGVVYFAANLAVPLRHFFYEGDVLWAEQGMRFAWKVMVREKSGSVTYHVDDPATGRRWQVSADRYLTRRQAQEMSGQPDLILKLAHHVARDFRQRFGVPVEVRAEAWVSLNGRAPALLVDPRVDLTHVDDGIAQAPWILPHPDEQRRLGSLPEPVAALPSRAQP